MSIVTASCLAAALGLLVSGGVVALLRARRPGLAPQLYWLLGLVAVLPAWLVVFIALLGVIPPEGQTGDLPRTAFMAATATGLLGVVLTDLLVRRWAERGGAASPVTAWLLGVAGLLPGWVVTLLLLTRAGG